MNCWNSRGISEEFQRLHLFQSFSSNFPWLQWNSTWIPLEWWKDFLVGKLLKLQAAPEVNMEPFNGNVLNYHHFMALFKGFVESKVEDPRERLIRLLKYISGEAKELINHCIQFPSNEGFKYAKYLLEKVYGNSHKITASYRKEIKQWSQFKFADASAFQKFYTFLVKCWSISFNRRWNALDSPDILCMLISKLPGGIMERWKWKVLNIRRYQVRETILDDMTDFIEEEAILM